MRGVLEAKRLTIQVDTVVLPEHPSSGPGMLEAVQPREDGQGLSVPRPPVARWKLSIFAIIQASKCRISNASVATTALQILCGVRSACGGMTVKVLSLSYMLTRAQRHCEIALRLAR